MMMDAGVFMPLRGTLPSFLRLCRRATLLVPCLLALPQAQAQSREDLQNLLFEPVAIDLIRPPGEEDAPAQMQELSTLPRGEQAQDLRAWLERHQADEDLAEAELKQRIADYERTIGELELAGGPYDPALSENLLSLGSAYQEQGDHRQALALFERAWHISRVNGGLYNLEQKAIVKELIESHLALGDLQRADEQQEYLFFIQQKTHGPGSPELLPALTELAEWNMFAYNLQAGVSRRDPRYGGMALRAQPMDSEGRENFLTRHLLNAQTLYRAIIQILLNSAGVADPRLLDAEKKLALTNYFFAKNYALVNNGFQQFSPAFTAQTMVLAGVDVGAPPINALGYRHGREALERRVEYLRGRQDVDLSALASALLDLGDWQLLFSKRTQAMEAYKEAWRVMANGGAEPAALLNPPVPVALPTFLLGNHTRAARGIPEDLPLAYKGYVDLRLQLSAWGVPQKVEVLGRSESASQEVADRLVSQVKRMQYRPRFRSDEPTNDDVALLRYYFTY